MENQDTDDLLTGPGLEEPAIRRNLLPEWLKKLLLVLIFYKAYSLLRSFQLFLLLGTGSVEQRRRFRSFMDRFYRPRSAGSFRVHFAAETMEIRPGYRHRCIVRFLAYHDRIFCALRYIAGKCRVLPWKKCRPAL